MWLIFLRNFLSTALAAFFFCSETICAIIDDIMGNIHVNCVKFGSVAQEEMSFK